MIINNVEFDENGKPQISSFDEIASQLLPITLKGVFYLLPLALGLYHTDFLVQSHLLRLASYITGFIAATVLWIIACVIPCFVFGVEYAFAKDVFSMFSIIELRISVTLVILLIPLSRFITNTIDRMANSYLYRRYIFCTALSIDFISLTAIINYAVSRQSAGIYGFSFITIGLFYSFLMIRKIPGTKTQFNQNIYDTYFSGHADEIK